MQRYAVIVQGIVQGVGFRPFVYSLASKHHLAGHVKNRMGTVFIEIEGAEENLRNFLDELSNKPPSLAQVDTISVEEQNPHGEREFRIETSDANGAAQVFLSPDVATCDACLAELFDPANRRYCYPFLNCTNCGPRLTIILGAPYDRANTTMAAFPMCPACRAEYENPADRRFHAQPTACAECGPHLQAFLAKDRTVETADPLAWFVNALHDGKIGALKGLGGYYLVCNAVDAGVVRKLRHRKHRDEKPFAVMVRDIKSAETLCEIDDAERELLLSPRRPIVLLRKRFPMPVAAEVAPANPWLGVMLPYTPLHHLLLATVNRPLVMTSGNCSDEPIAYQDDDALERLAGIADVFLLHNRPIHVRCDDSVTRILEQFAIECSDGLKPDAQAKAYQPSPSLVRQASMHRYTRPRNALSGVEMPVRRSRGYAPEPLSLPVECPAPVLAVGGQLKATFALGRDHHAFVSHHMGDLDHFDAYRAFVQDIALYQDLFSLQPRLLAHDLHPDYQSTVYARQRASREEIELIPVQHHHAHLASCMAEHRLTEPVIGVTFDGTGFGTDGAVWGGEFLVGDYGGFRRAAHFRYVGMPGGEQAIREPWRMALAHLLDAGCETTLLEHRIEHQQLRTLQQMLERRFNTPMTSSSGRLFDAVAALAGVRDRVSYEGQAAMELEWLGMRSQDEGVYPFSVDQVEHEEKRQSCFIVDTRPLIRSVFEDVKRGIQGMQIARRFHSTLVEVITTVCNQIRKTTCLDTVVLSGGVFMNMLLTGEVMARLREVDFRVYRHQRVPPGDGGLSLGQLAIAAQTLQARSTI